MSGTPRLCLPFLSVGQAQKEFTHNEALQILDIVVGGAVEEPPRASPPSATALGTAYIVGVTPTDAWAESANCVAAWTSGGWRFVEPTDGLAFEIKSNGLRIVFRDGAWELGSVRASALIVADQQVVGSRAAAIASPSGGATVDSEARAAVDAILAALREHGLIDV